jgi:hypothetical protein
MTMRNRLLMLAAAGAFAASTAGAQAGPAPAASGGGPDLFPLLPAACTVLKPIFKSAKYKRQLTGEELMGSTLTCWLGPLGYVIAVKKGWIEPNPYLGPRD